MVDLEGKAVEKQETMDGNGDLMLGVCAKMRAGLPVTNSFRLFQVVNLSGTVHISFVRKLPQTWILIG